MDVEPLEWVKRYGTDAVSFQALKPGVAWWVDDPRPEDMHWVGTTANILRYVTGPDGSPHLGAQGEGH